MVDAPQCQKVVSVIITTVNTEALHGGPLPEKVFLAMLLVNLQPVSLGY